MPIAVTAAQPAPQDRPMPGEVRYHQLDALRGLAAMTVVFHHFALLWTPQGPQSRWWTLLNPLTDGLEAVMLFFLLSGFVLSVPYLRGKGQRYRVYLARRILRIYGPYLLALALAVAGAAHWWPRWPVTASDSSWTHPVLRSQVLQHVLFLGNYEGGQFNTAFWSLVVEMRVSLVFPLLYLAFHRLRPRWAVPAALVCTVLGFALMRRGLPIGLLGQTILYGSVFLAGITLATNFARAGAWYRGLRPAGRALVGAGSFVIYTWGIHMAAYLQPWVQPDVVPVGLWLVTLGAAGYMVIAINAPGVSRVLNGRGPQWLGRVSYSLYLVHGTVLFALARTLGRAVSPVWQFLLYVPLSLALAWVFCLLVEEPFLRLGRRVGRRRVAPAPVPQEGGSPERLPAIPPR